MIRTRPQPASSSRLGLFELRALTLPTLARIEQTLLRPVDAAWLATFRILFGITMAISMQRLLAYKWIESLIVGSGPRFRFHYWGFGWVEPPSLHTANTLVWILMGLAIAIACGAAFRVASLLFAVGLTYIQLIDVSTYLNHYYLAGLLAWLFALSPANRTWSIDSLLLNKKSTDTVPTAWLYVFRVQIAVVYLGAAIAKLQPDWLLHGQPLAIWIGARTDLPLLGRLFTLPHVPIVLSWLGFLFDATIVLWLSMKRTRPYAYVVVILFHAFTRVLFDIGMFPFIMSVAALVFFDPSWPRRFFFGKSSPPRVPLTPIGGKTAPWKRLLLAVATLYCATQIVLPLRGFLYGGNVNWHEQGMRFSWRVMVRAKGGATTFLVRVPATNHVYHVSPRDYLTPYQENEMSGQPDLILQLAHHIARDFESRGFGSNIEVRAESDVSLNGRRGSPMIDPSVDLTKVKDGVGLARYIMPAPTDTPPDIHPVL